MTVLADRRAELRRFAPQDRSTAIDHALFGLLPAIIVLWLVAVVYADGISAVDYRHDFWVAGFRVLHGTDLYSWTRGQILNGISFPYPAAAGVILAPLALLSRATSAGIFTALCIASLVLTLRVLEVRDWRIYGVALLWAPVVTGWQAGNLTLPLTLATAVIWRYRDRPALTGVLVALVVAIKPIMLPLALWLIATRRFAAGAYAAAAVLAINAVAWAVVGFTELPRWLQLLNRQSHLVPAKGYGVIAIAIHLGFSREVGIAVTVLLAAAAAAAVVVLARQGRETAAFALSVALTVIVSPQVDGHYLALLAVPLVICVPRLRPIWFAPLLLWVTPAADANTLQQIIWWCVFAAVTAWLIARPMRTAQ